MTVLRTAELITGIGTGLSTATSLFLLMSNSPPDGFGSAWEIWPWLLLYGLPGLLLALGAYNHSVGNKSWGVKVVFCIAGLSAIWILILLFGGVFGYLGVWRVLHWVAPTVMSVLTGMSALLVVLSEKF